MVAFSKLEKFLFFGDLLATTPDLNFRAIYGRIRLQRTRPEKSNKDRLKYQRNHLCIYQGEPATVVAIISVLNIILIYILYIAGLLAK